MGVLKLMGAAGDQRIAWDPADKSQISKAKAKFDQMVKNMKYLAFRMDETGKKGEQIKEFDENAGAILVVAPIVGG